MTTKAKHRDRLKRAAAKNRNAKRAGVLAGISASAEIVQPLSIYAGNSALADEARDAWKRADAWAQAPAGTKYGGMR